MKLISTICAAAICLVASSSAWAQSLTPQEVISGAIPSQVLASDLKPEWKAVRITLPSGGGGFLDMIFGSIGSMMGSLGRAGGGGDSENGMKLMSILNIYWTEGKTIKMDGESFLVTYRFDPDISDINIGADAPPDFTKLPLQLQMVSLKHVTSFSPQTQMTKEKYIEILKQASQKPAPVEGAPTTPPPSSSRTEPEEIHEAADAQQQCLSNIKQVSLAMAIYCTDYDEVLPYAQSSATARYVIYPYLKNPSAYRTMHETKDTFRFNTKIGGCSISEIDQPERAVLFFDPVAWPNGLHAVSFVDGSAKWATWDEIQALLDRPYPPKRTKPLPKDYGVAEMKELDGR